MYTTVLLYLGILRSGAIVHRKDWENNREYFWPNVTCQKLFYDEHAIVNPISHVKSDISMGNNVIYIT